MSKKAHIHKYYRAQLPFGKVWACALSDCNHHMPQHYESLMLGKKSLCTACGEVMSLTEHNLNTERPLCFNCEYGLNILDKIPG
jgi:hypothetical protein